MTLIVDLVAMIFGAFGTALLDMFPEDIEKSEFATGYAAFVSVLLCLWSESALNGLGGEAARS